MNDLQWYTVGDARILKIQDLTLAALTPELLLPDWDDATALQAYPDLSETLDASETKVLLSVHSWLIKDRGRNILVDTGAGNSKARPAALYFDHLQTVWLENLMRAGVRPEDIDFVLLTHLHVDHVGWNTRLQNGIWVPTFPNARYVFSRAEYDFFSNPAHDSVRNKTSFMTRIDSVDPIISADLADQIDVDGSEVLEGISFHPTPGHTPHHASLVLKSGMERALFTGDVMHHPIQVCIPEWSAVFDADPQIAIISRKWALNYAAEHTAAVFTSHFPMTSAGKVMTYDQGRGWSFL
ncbi:MBL fold metallo-hydrolase [Acetobacter cibinongensis]|uniref:Beta-lactamase n=1 Tax=Acetobacter cibinongensis TaxID=146475 RepID=A0A0D6N7G6_9PROT|nr:MBL fold metallo-hydrolase [Acetobacter cibinongensis]GAN61640.1 beta-lactamase [Acetobacter cibinongensis]GBQ15755.1 beta-lactamase domain-containing protein [Acetobacter cibinongensis NRIC 0482]GEL59971.1 MBL fold metallo-hydrolase [Acetobacter cibinongensis]